MRAKILPFDPPSLIPIVIGELQRVRAVDED